MAAPNPPRIVGKYFDGATFDPAHGTPAIPNFGETTPELVAAVLISALTRHDPNCALAAPETPRAALGNRPAPVRSPGFCAGCPHNRSTMVPEGSRALAGIGCHWMATLVNPLQTATASHMGGEGAMWLGQQPFTSQQHVFANLGDGTYAHSGSLAIRQAVAADVPITYKILYNGFVSMTGGQPIEGGMTPVQILAECAAEGVKKMALVADDPDRYAGVPMPPGVTLRHRDEMDETQREFREYEGVSVILYDQPCATERRRLRKRGKWADPAIRTFIHPEVCEGCGDCGKVSNCMAIEPLETEFGRKRRINQSSCNKDYSCVDGFCPSFVTVHGGSLRKVDVATPLSPYLPPVPEPALPAIGKPYNILVAGIGGSGVVTVSQTLAVAAYLDGLFSSNLDLTGLSQKYGAVTAHVRIARTPDALHATRIAAGEADAMIGCDLIVAASDECLSKLNAGSSAVISADLTPTADFARNPNWSVDADALIERLKSALGDKAFVLDAQRLAQELLGDPIASNMFMLGAAWQRGLVPLRRAAIDRAIELNGVAIAANRQAFEWGRRAAHDLTSVESLAARDEQTRACSVAGRADRAARLAYCRVAGRGGRETLSVAGRARARRRAASRSRRGADHDGRPRLSQADRGQGRVGSRAPLRFARLPARAQRRVRRPLQASFSYRRLALRPARPADRRDRQGRSGALGNDGLPHPRAAQIPARDVARSVPLERRAQARAPARRRIRGRHRGTHRPPHAGESCDRGRDRRPAGDHTGIWAGQGGQRQGGGEGARQSIRPVEDGQGADGVGGMSLTGKTVVVTGGMGALGRVVAETAAARGASVAVLDHATKVPDGLAERLGANALFLGGIDLSSPAEAEKAMGAVKAKFGRIDALLNIAGGFQWATLEDGAADSWDRMYALNLKTALNASKAALPYLLASGAGRIVNVGAQSAVHGAAGFGPYGASKSAVHRLTESLADELKLKGVTVNAVLPSIIDTPANRADMPKADFARWVAPADLAAVMLFLASDEAKAVTGALIPVTGRV